MSLTYEHSSRQMEVGREMVPSLPQGEKKLWHIILRTLSRHSAVAEMFVVGILLRVAAI